MDQLLYGHNPDERIVAVQHTGENSIRIYVRTPDGIHTDDLEFFPYFHLADSSYLNGVSTKHWVRRLSGNNYYRYLCAFVRWSDMWDAIHLVIDHYNRGTLEKVENYSDLPILHLKPDPIYQFLTQSGRTLFKGMDFDDLHRLQLDIETYTKQGQKSSNANRLEDRIIVITLSDNRGWEHIIDGRHKSEKAMLQELATLIRDKDPDVVEGHNIYGFDLPYLMKRCELHDLELRIGRDGSAPHPSTFRSVKSDRAGEHGSYEIAGRHIIDTMLLLKSYDLSKRTLESYGLKYAAQHFGFAKTDRTYVPGNRISWYWDNEPEPLLRYALDDVHETRQLSEYLSPSTFYLTQMVPMNYGTIARSGSVAKIESLLLREYVRNKFSIPKPTTGTQTTGGYTDIFFTGILGPILHIDVESLYPSIMLSEKIAPTSDELNVFLGILDDITLMRIEVKRSMKRANSKTEKSKYDALQSSLKILINSFYGYLGYGKGLFNDVEAADRVTKSGQHILRQLIAAIVARHGTVVEVDTDGIFFVPPGNVRDEKSEKTFVDSLSAELPKGINLGIDGRYKKILSYKMKNYALLTYDDQIRIKGSSLISRSIEKFGRDFIRRSIESLLADDVESLHQVYANFYKDIFQHRLTVGDFARTETLRDTLEIYSQEIDSGKRNRTASYEVALSTALNWKPGDRISYYFTGSDSNIRGFEHCKHTDDWDPNFPDENTAYYLKRLDEFAKKFEVFFEMRDYRAIFSVDDLFGFSAEGIELLRQPARKEESASEEESESATTAPRIWLDEN